MLLESFRGRARGFCSYALCTTCCRVCVLETCLGVCYISTCAVCMQRELLAKTCMSCHVMSCLAAVLWQLLSVICESFSKTCMPCHVMPSLRQGISTCKPSEGKGKTYEFLSLSCLLSPQPSSELWNLNSRLKDQLFLCIVSRDGGYSGALAVPSPLFWSSPLTCVLGFADRLPMQPPSHEDYYVLRSL